MTAKNLSIQHKYNSYLELELLEGNYLIYDQKLQTPINIKLSINKRGDSYHLRADVELYSYVGSQQNLFNLKKLEIVVIPDRILKQSPDQTVRFQVIPPKSWISKHTPRSTYTNKLTWYREGILPAELLLRKNRFGINLYYLDFQ